jgi:hypothetical protein
LSPRRGPWGIVGGCPGHSGVMLGGWWPARSAGHTAGEYDFSGRTAPVSYVSLLRCCFVVELCSACSYASAGTGSRLGVTVSVVRSVGREVALGRAPCLVVPREGMQRPRGRPSRRRIASVPAMHCSGCRRGSSSAPRSMMIRGRGAGVTVWEFRLIGPVVAVVAILV